MFKVLFYFFLFIFFWGGGGDILSTWILKLHLVLISILYTQLFASFLSKRDSLAL